MYEYDANIVATGPSSAGKTVATACMYAQMTKPDWGEKETDDDTPYFGLVVEGDEAGADIMRLAAMNAAMRKHEKLPDGTKENTFYQFAFQRDRKTICHIRWMDYRGAMGIDRDKDPEEWAEFNDMSQHMALLIYIIDGNIIDQYIRLGEGRVSEDDRIDLEDKISEEMNQVLSLIDNAKKVWQETTGEKEDKRPILFYITKSDLIKYDDERKLNALISLLRAYRIFKLERKILGCHSTLGRNLVLDKNNKIISGYKPEGFEIPLMLAVGFILSEQGKMWEREENARLESKIFAQQMKNTKNTQEIGRLSGKYTNKLLELFKKKNKQIEALNSEIVAGDNNVKNWQAEQNGLRANNTLNQYSQEILDYIKKGTYVIYMGEDGKQQDLEHFFE